VLKVDSSSEFRDKGFQALCTLGVVYVALPDLSIACTVNFKVCEPCMKLRGQLFALIVVRVDCCSR
jgi:hypothetical protein